jgi:glycosyltransferase involved in cell wall biosynthesis
MPKVSVVIPTYNYGRFIGEAIESILAQTYPASEIIVVDDGSTDDTEQAAKKFGDKVRYIKKENGGVCSARNVGIKNASGDFVVFFDADDISHPAKIERQLAKFAEDSEIGLVHCGVRDFDSQGNTTQYHLVGEEGWVADDMLLMKPVVIGPGGTIMVKREAFAAVGDFDERLEIYEDWEFCYRVARKFKVGFVPEVLLDRRIHGSNSQTNIKKLERSVLLAFAKIFETTDEKILRLRRESYGNLFKILAGSYLDAGNHRMFIKYLVKSLWLKPGNIQHYLEFPVRQLRKSDKSKSV